jgi:hypothetical protein
MKRIIGVDPGSDSCGVTILDEGKISMAVNATIPEFWDIASKNANNDNVIFVIEDIKPYSVQLMPQIISTCKFIGEAVYRLKYLMGAKVQLITRYEVKKWVFDSFKSVCEPLVDKKILKKAFRSCDISTKEEVLMSSDGSRWKGRKASFVYVDDKIVMQAMKHLYNIPMPPPGSGYEYGLKDDSWQALAVASFYYANH